LNIIEQWSETKAIEAFIKEINTEITLQPPENQPALIARLNKATQSLGNVSALHALSNWTSPDERH